MLSNPPIPMNVERQAARVFLAVMALVAFAPLAAAAAAT